jgi:hypothetical protein
MGGGGQTVEQLSLHLTLHRVCEGMPAGGGGSKVWRL